MKGGERIVTFGLAAAVASLVYHKKVGLADGDDMNIVRLILRPDVLFAAVVAAGFFFFRSEAFLLRVRGAVAGTVLVVCPWLVIFLTGLASLVAFSQGQASLDAFGVQTAARLVLCTAVGVLVYNRALAQPALVVLLMRILTWAPAVSLAVALLLWVAPGALGLLLGGQALNEGVDGVLAYGGRFQGLTSNPNMVATSSAIAIALLWPELGHLRTLQRPAGLLKLAYIAGLLVVIQWSGVRAMIPVLTGVFLLSTWFQAGQSPWRSLGATLVVVGLGGLAYAVGQQAEAGEVLTSRLQETDGRLFLWRFYADTLLSHPLGFGFAWEAIMDTESIIAGQRLPTHNTLLEVGMHGGWLAIAAHVLVLVLIGATVVRLRRMAAGPERELAHALGLAVTACVSSLLFAGLVFGDLSYAVTVALLLATAVRWQRRGQLPGLPKLGLPAGGRR